MSVLDALKEMRERKREKRERFKEAQEELKIHKILTERQKSANERELEKFVKEEREEAIKDQLEKYRKKEKYESEFGHNPLNAKNIMKGDDYHILKDKNIMVNHQSILHQKNIFAHKKGGKKRK